MEKYQLLLHNQSIRRSKDEVKYIFKYVKLNIFKMECKLL